MGHEAAEPHNHLAEPRSAALLKRGSVSEADFLALMQQVSVSFNAGSIILTWSRQGPQKCLSVGLQEQSALRSSGQWW